MFAALLAIFPTIWSVVTTFFSGAVGHTGAMGAVIDALLNSPTGEGILNTLEGILGPIEQAKKQEFIAQLDSLLGQIEIDKIEAASPSLFIAGWRPFLCWGLSIALLLSVLVEPTIDYIFSFFGWYSPPPVVLSPSVMYLIAGLCGLYMAGRTFEKYSGVSK